MSKQIPFKEICKAAAKMTAKQFVKKYIDSNQITYYECDNLLEPNEGTFILTFLTRNKYNYHITFINGKCYSIEWFDRRYGNDSSIKTKLILYV